MLGVKPQTPGMSGEESNLCSSLSCESEEWNYVNLIKDNKKKRAKSILLKVLPSVSNQQSTFKTGIQLHVLKQIPSPFSVFLKVREVHRSAIADNSPKFFFKVFCQLKKSRILAAA